MSDKSINLTKGMTLDSARTTVDQLSQRLSQFKYGFDIPKSIAANIVHRRLSTWNETDNSNEIASTSTATGSQLKSREVNLAVNVNSEPEICADLPTRKKKSRKRSKNSGNTSRKRQRILDTDSSSDKLEIIEEKVSVQKRNWNWSPHSMTSLLFTDCFKLCEDDGYSTKAKCKLCKKLLSCTSGINSNLKEHVRRVSIFWDLFCCIFREFS